MSTAGDTMMSVGNIVSTAGMFSTLSGVSIQIQLFSQ